MLSTGLFSDSRIGPAREFSSSELQVRARHESAPDTPLDSPSAVLGAGSPVVASGHFRRRFGLRRLSQRFRAKRDNRFTTSPYRGW
jgi:hypothetical protein